MHKPPSVAVERNPLLDPTAMTCQIWTQHTAADRAAVNARHSSAYIAFLDENLNFARIRCRLWVGQYKVLLRRVAYSHQDLL